MTGGYRPVLALLFLTLLCAGAPLIGQMLGIDPHVTDLSARFAPPSWPHLLGTDELGRDVFLRLLEGGRVSLAVGAAAAIAAALLGTAAGLTAGYAGGWHDALLMRLADLLMALPVLPLLIVLSALDAGKLGFPAGTEIAAQLKIIVLIALLGWPATARLVRTRTRTLREMDYVRAAQALGVRRGRILLRHIFPNLANTVAVAAALAVGNIILMESALSFLGLGIRPPMASWGNMLTTAGETLWDYPLLSVWPGLMIFATVLSCNALADRLREKQG